MCISINNIKSSHKIIAYGIQQGSVLGQLLFLVHPFIFFVNCIYMFCRGYAVLLISGKLLQNVQTSANYELCKSIKLDLGQQLDS